jgi:NAD-dependent dihydropyrimidine dehydrogenase PreA subunit
MGERKKNKKEERSIIEIDHDLCTGCGACVEACDEHALQVKGEKCVLKGECFCHGHGICVDVCPTGALKIVERVVDEFEEEEVKRYLQQTGGNELVKRAITHFLGARKP